MTEDRDSAVLGDRRLHIFGLLAVAVPLVGPRVGVRSETSAAVGVGIILAYTFSKGLKEQSSGGGGGASR